MGKKRPIQALKVPPGQVSRSGLSACAFHPSRTLPLELERYCRAITILEPDPAFFEAGDKPQLCIFTKY